ncbi:MAG: sec-independent protein translocase protein TatC [Solirubrobacteraceae bacterium]|jgi:sec-independent protein translocase protein TatC|nr:sec-independent protein translocase protein TatC [Solirubrobacteraceae bacterium]
MASPIRPIRHEDRLSLVEHLTELRTRLIVSALALAVAFGVCVWQNQVLLDVVNAPLAKQTRKQVEKGNGTLGQTALADKAILALAAIDKKRDALLSASGSGLKPGVAAQLAGLDREITAATARIPRTPLADKPVTLGLGEPFTSTITVAFYFALLLALPVILFQAYAFVLPAFSPTERRIAMPLMLAIPFLFLIGVLFGYFVVFPASVKFFQNFNSDSYNVLVQASAYYRFEALILLAMGLIFQVPVGILAATRAGIVTPAQLRKNRRYAVVVAAAIAALLPGDAITMALETAPLVLLYEISLRLASFIEKRTARRTAAAAAGEAAKVRPTAPIPVAVTPSVAPVPVAVTPSVAPIPPVVSATAAPIPPPAPPPATPARRAAPPASSKPRAPAAAGETTPASSSPTAEIPIPVQPQAPAAGTGPADPASAPLAPPPIPPTAPPPRPTEEEDDDAL